MMSELKPPIILLGNVRSGTTMKQELFALHPGIVTWYEPRTVWIYADPGREHDRFDEHDARPDVVRYIRKRFLKYQNKHNDKIVMEKTPSNILRIPYVNRIFPESRYLYMIRDPLAYLSSAELKWQLAPGRQVVFRRLKETPKRHLHYHFKRFVSAMIDKKILKKKYVSVWGVRYPEISKDIKKLDVTEVIAKQWVECSRQAEHDLQFIDEERVFKLRYEDFVEEPVSLFQEVCDHFGVECPEHLKNKVKESVDPGRRNKWQRLDRRIIEQCMPILKEEMGRHGYSLPSRRVL